MDWIQFVIFAISVLGLFFWNRSETRQDMRHMEQKLDANRELTRAIHEDSKNMITAIREDFKNFQLTMAQETKDFHGRLCAIEERSKGLNKS